MTGDVFRPHGQPARTLYDAFQKEASRRKGRSFDEWNSAEVDAVLRAAEQVFPAHALPVPTKADVESAQAYAMGSIDYGATWAYALISKAERSKR